MDKYGWIEFSIGLFTCVFAAPIYIVFLYMIARYRKLSQFNIPFYGLVFQCGLLDLWYIVHQHLFFNNFLVTLVPQMFLWARVQLATVFFYGYFYIHSCQAMAVLIISINRFTALVMPLRHDLIWTRKLTWMMIVSQHLFAAVTITPALVNSCWTDFIIRPNKTNFEFIPPSPFCAPRVGGPSALFALVLSVLLIVLYSIMFVKVRQSNTAVSQGDLNEAAKNQEKVQRSLALGGAIISLTLVLISIHSLVSIFVVKHYSYYPPILRAFKWLFNTLFCVVNPFVLLCFGSKIRPYFWKCVKQIVCIKEDQPTQNMNKRSATRAKINENAVIEQSL